MRSFDASGARNVSGDASGGRRRLPDFIATGPARTGTTWLHHALSGSVHLPHGTKETYFFTIRYRCGIDWYAWHFADTPSGMLAGEVCPYFAAAQAPSRIAKHIPGCKIICTLRDPVQRAWSHYRMLRNIAAAKVSFEEALSANPFVAEGSRYPYHLAQWIQHFGRENVLITFYDRLRDDPAGYLDEICDFLGIERINISKMSFTAKAINSVDRPARNRRRARRANKLLNRLRLRRAYRMIDFLERSGFMRFAFGGGPPFEPLDRCVEARVRELFRPEVVALEDMIERDLSGWKAQARAGRRLTSS